MKPECSAIKEKMFYWLLVYLKKHKKKHKWASSKCANSIVFVK